MYTCFSFLIAAVSVERRCKQPVKRTSNMSSRTLDEKHREVLDKLADTDEERKRRLIDDRDSTNEIDSPPMMEPRVKNRRFE
jgi:hypothetical protein